MDYARPSKKRLRDLLSRLEAAGCRIRGGGSRHYVVFLPDGVHTITISASPGNGNYVKQTLSRARRYGLDV